MGLVGDAGLTLDALIGELKQTIKSNRDPKDVVAEITKVRGEWMEQWRPMLETVAEEWIKKADHKGYEGRKMLDDLRAMIKAGSS